MASSIKKLFHWKTILKTLAGIVLIALVFLLCRNWYQDYEHRKYVAGLKHTASPNVTILVDTIVVDYIDPDDEGYKRSLAIYLPTDYHENDTTRYPVIYFMDGDSQFDDKISEATEWQVDEVVDSISEQGGPSTIVVGVYNHPTQRLTEYKPFPSEHVWNEKVVTGPEHAEWLATDVKNWIDQRYRTLSDPDHTTIGGCSLGGLMSWYMISHFPDVYGNALIFSPSLWVGHEVYTWQNKLADWNDKKIYLCAGTIEAPVLEWAEKLHTLLEEKGMTADNLRIDPIQDEGHWHMCWRKAFQKAYPWIVE